MIIILRENLPIPKNTNRQLSFNPIKTLTLIYKYKNKILTGKNKIDFYKLNRKYFFKRNSLINNFESVTPIEF